MGVRIPALPLTTHSWANYLISVPQSPQNGNSNIPSYRVVMRMKIISESVRIALACCEHYVTVDYFICYQVVVNFLDPLKYYA